MLQLLPVWQVQCLLVMEPACTGFCQNIGTYSYTIFLTNNSLFLRYRMDTHHNLLSQTFSLTCDTEKCTDDAFKKQGKNQNVTTEISSNGLFPSDQTSNRSLTYVFTKLKATLEQKHDLLNFRQKTLSTILNITF